MAEHTLTEAEREALVFTYNSPHISVESAVEAILAARLARVEALAERWGRDNGPITLRHAAALRAALAPVEPATEEATS